MTAFDPDSDIDFDQAKDVLRLFSEKTLKPSAIEIFIHTMMNVFGKEIPTGDGEISDWIINIAAMSPGKSPIETKWAFQHEVRKFEKVLDLASNPHELLSAVHELYPDGQWKKGVSLSKVTRYLMEKAGIHQPLEMPPDPHHLRAVQAIARCFEILKDSPFNLIKRAREGDRSALLGLVKIDKLFLHDSCTRSVITEAERCQDSAFLKQLAGAIRYKPRGGPRVVFRCLLYIFFELEIELPKYSEFQGWLDPEGKIFRGIYAFEKFVRDCRKEFNSLKERDSDTNLVT